MFCKGSNDLHSELLMRSMARDKALDEQSRDPDGKFGSGGGSGGKEDVGVSAAKKHREAAAEHEKNVNGFGNRQTAHAKAQGLHESAAQAHEEAAGHHRGSGNFKKAEAGPRPRIICSAQG